MKIGVVGLGYVGIVTAAVLADQGHQIIGVDIDRNKILKLRDGKSVIFEPGLDELISRNHQRFTFTSNYDELKGTEVIFICVSTPDRDGQINLDYVFSACDSIMNLGSKATVVIKSTVVPGTAGKVFERTGIKIVSNPEFLREGSAIHDTIHPDRIVIGSGEPQSSELLRKLWEFTKAPVLETTNENAELIKYASNAFLATKISFINEIADLCEKIPGADVNVIAEGMGYDRRIAPEFLRAGLGFGGSCFPKDTRALISFAKEKGVDARIVESAVAINNNRVNKALDRMEAKFGSLKSKNICVLGLSFKNDTDDIRYSKSWELVEELNKRGGLVKAFDPTVKSAQGINVTGNPDQCIEKSDFVIVATEWKEFNKLNLSTAGHVFDFRRILDKGKADMMVGVYDKN